MILEEEEDSDESATSPLSSRPKNKQRQSDIGGSPLIKL